MVIVSALAISRSSHQRCSVKNGAIRNFTKFTGKHLCQSFFFNKVAGLSPSTLLKKRLWHRCFLVNFMKFLRKPFFTEHFRWLLLSIIGSKACLLRQLSHIDILRCWDILGQIPIYFKNCFCISIFTLLSTKVFFIALYKTSLLWKNTCFNSFIKVCLKKFRKNTGIVFVYFGWNVIALSNFRSIWR